MREDDFIQEIVSDVKDIDKELEEILKKQSSKVKVVSLSTLLTTPI